MDPALYKTTTTTRGLTYRYWCAPARAGQPTLLLCHGFPCTAHDWRHVAPRLAARGLGVLAPDMLGYGGTDAPADPAAYVFSRMTRDLVDILDAERVPRAIAVGHDWGCGAVSKLANFHPERFAAYAFLTVPYNMPAPALDVEAVLAQTKEAFGYEVFGYWLFFASDDAPQLLLDHLDAFASVLWPHDPLLWKTHVAPRDAMRRTLLTDFRAPRPPYISEADKAQWMATFRARGFDGPTCWYKQLVRGLAAADDQQIPPERTLPPPDAPLFFGAATHDYLCRPAAGYALFGGDAFKAHDITMKEYDADHWVLLSHPKEVCRDLVAWIEGVVVARMQE